MDDMPLDLGAKRSSEAAFGNSLPTSASPTKLVKLESSSESKPPSGTLFKVTEPSVLQASAAASTITAVVNEAIKKEEDQDVKPDSKATPPPPGGYVHKLKKAWITQYSGNDNDNNSNNEYSAPSTPNQRATPSPALSSASASSNNRAATSKTGGGRSSSNNLNGSNKNNNKSTPDNEGTEESSDNSEISSSASRRGKRGGGSGSGGRGSRTRSGTPQSSSKTGGNNGRVTKAKKGKKASSTSSRTATGKKPTRSSARSSRSAVASNEEDFDSSSDSDDGVASDTTSSSRRSNRGSANSTSSSSRGGRRSAATSAKLASGRNTTEDEAAMSDTSSLEANPKNPFNQPPIHVRKKTGKSFLQDKTCNEMNNAKLAKCRECKWSDPPEVDTSRKNGGNSNVNDETASASTNIFCRFYGFRRLKYHKNGQLGVSGFLDPHSKEDVTSDDADMWEANAENAPEGLSVDQAKYCLQLLKYDFDLIVKQERQAVKEHIGEDEKVAWKRVCQGVSETCDVCETVLFSLHWACRRCGFAACLDCYISRKNSETTEADAKTNKNSNVRDEDAKDKFSWLLCTNKSTHDLEKLMLTQMVTGNVLEDMMLMLEKTGLEFKKPKVRSTKKLANGDNKSGDDQDSVDTKEDDAPQVNGKPETQEKEKEEPQKKGASLRDLIGSKEEKVKMSDLIEAFVEDSLDEDALTFRKALTHFVRTTDEEQDKTYVWRHGFAPGTRSYLNIETRSIYPNVNHSWLNHGRVLRMEGATDSPQAVELFQEVWSRGQPIVVANATKALNLSKWYPSNLNDEFGDEKSDFVNVNSGESLGFHPMKKFWDGYSFVNKRNIKDDKGDLAILRLSGWPSTYGDEFKEVLPARSAEFLRMLPVPCYTGRAGPLNLAASLPDTFARAEVGPRAVITYGDIKVSK